MVHKIIILLAALHIGISISVTATADSAQPTLSQQAETIAATVMSPFCPGRLLKDCPSSSATELKHTIIKRLEQGESAEVIMRSLIATYGEEIRAAPQAEGFGILAWVAPFALLLGGLLFVLVWIRSRKNMIVESSVATTTDVSAAMKRRIDKLLD